MCIPADTRTEQLAVVEAWAREGRARGERCVYIAEHAADPGLRAALGTGVVIVSPEESYLRGGGFEAGRAVAWMRDAIEDGLSAGYAAVRVCAETIAAAPFDPHQLAAYEVKVDELARDRRVTVVCVYDRARMAAGLICDAFTTHPLVCVRDVLCRNPRYVAPEHHLAVDRPAGEVAMILDQLYAAEMRHARSRAWARTMLGEVERQRAELARALHDDIGQCLVALGLAGRGDEVGEAIEAVRAMARDLRPSALDDLGLVAAVRSLATREALRANAAVSLELAVDDAGLRTETATTCYRIVEAALANVVAHSRATRLAVELRGMPDAIEVVVRDDGVGFVVLATQGAGLADMAERAELLGGALDIDSRPGRGTTIRARVPT